MCNDTDPDDATADRGGTAVPVIRPKVPVARPITITPVPGPAPEPLKVVPGRPLVPEPVRPDRPELKLCDVGFVDGCYAVTIRRTGSLWGQVGTVRVDRAAPRSGPDGLIMSGDLYGTRLRPIGLPEGPFEVLGKASSRGVVAGSASAAATASQVGAKVLPRPQIPIYPRRRYEAYLRGMALSAPRIVLGHQPCQVTLDFDQFDYTQPPAGQHKGSFPTAPSRSVRFVLRPVAAPSWPLGSGPRFEGRLYEGGVDKGEVTLTWVSRFLRRAVLEIDTLKGAVPPEPVPHPSGTGTQYFDTLFATAGWQLRVERDQTGIPVPAGVNAKDCWSSAALHDLMTSVRRAGTDLDAEWRTHLVVVPAKITCSRGVMYDQIGVPREGSASFSDDGYPTSHSAHFGTAAGKKQREVPRAYLRSAAHEVTHAFNQIHQEQETAADNSIMTTTPSVADVLGGAATGAPGVFPDAIAIEFNATVRNHLAHMPDPVVRPGGWPFASWFGGSSPQAQDRATFDPSELRLEVSVTPERAALGAPVEVTWTLTNTSDTDLVVPNDLSLEGLMATLTVTNDRGEARPVRPFVIVCDHVRLEPLAPGASIEASYRTFWSTAGFAFDRPGRHLVTVSLSWSAGGVPVGVDDVAEVWVDSPVSDAENAEAALVLHPSVGMWVALGGGATHLTEAVDRLSALAGTGAGDGAADGDGGGGSRVAAAFGDLLPPA